MEPGLVGRHDGILAPRVIFAFEMTLIEPYGVFAHLSRCRYYNLRVTARAELVLRKALRALAARAVEWLCVGC